MKMQGNVKFTVVIEGNELDVRITFGQELMQMLKNALCKDASTDSAAQPKEEASEIPAPKKTEELDDRIAEFAEKANEVNTQAKQEQKKVTKPKKETQVMSSAMKCMPKIPWFESALERIDKAKTIRQRVGHILSAMGLFTQNIENSYEISMFAEKAIMNENITSGFLQEGDAWSALAFDKFLSDFILRNKCNTTVKISDFFKQLRPIILTEEEMKAVKKK